MHLFRSPLFQESARPVVASYRDRAFGNRYGRRSVAQRIAAEAAPVVAPVGNVVACAFVADAAADHAVVQFDQAA